MREGEFITVQIINKYSMNEADNKTDHVREKFYKISEVSFKKSNLPTINKSLTMRTTETS